MGFPSRMIRMKLCAYGSVWGLAPNRRRMGAKRRSMAAEKIVPSTALSTSVLPRMRPASTGSRGFSLTSSLRDLPSTYSNTR